MATLDEQVTTLRRIARNMGDDIVRAAFSNALGRFVCRSLGHPTRHVENVPGIARECFCSHVRERGAPRWQIYCQRHDTKFIVDPIIEWSETPRVPIHWSCPEGDWHCKEYWVGPTLVHL